MVAEKSKDRITVKTNRYSFARKLSNWLLPWFDAASQSADGDPLARFENGTADAHATPEIRQEIKENVRREVVNNPYLVGQNKVAENDVIGRTPRRKITDPRFTRQERRAIKKAFDKWMKDVKFASKLRTWLTESDDAGEGIAIMFPIDPSEKAAHPHVYKNKLLWGFRLIDSDRLTTYHGGDQLDPNNVDGVIVNKYDDVIEYKFLKEHPGADHNHINVDPLSTTTISSKYVFRLYRRARAEQIRGVSQKASSILLAGWMRQYMFAIVKAARKLASVNAVLRTNLPPQLSEALDENGNVILNDDGNPVMIEDRPEVGDTFDLDPDSIPCLPDSYDLSQITTEAVGDNHSEFVSGGVSAAGRARCMPESKATGSAARYNYASVRQDGQDWSHCNRVQQYDIELECCDPVFELWYSEAILVEGLLPDTVRTKIGPDDEPISPEGIWYWDAPEHVDPQKEGRALTERFRNGTDNPDAALLKNGVDPDDFYEQAAEAYGLEPNEEGIREYKKLVRNWVFQIPPEPAQQPQSVTQNMVQEMVEQAVQNWVED